MYIGFGVWGLGVRIGFGVWGFRVWVLGFRVWSLGFEGLKGLGSRLWRLRGSSHKIAVTRFVVFMIVVHHENNDIHTW